MAARGEFYRTFKYLSEVIANALAYEQGAIACYDTSTDTFKPAAAANANLIPVGYFTRSGTGTGAVEENVIRLFNEVKCQGFENAGSNTVVAADRFSNVYLDGPATVCNLATGRSVAGRVIAFSRADDGFTLVYVAPPTL